MDTNTGPSITKLNKTPKWKGKAAKDRCYEELIRLLGALCFKKCSGCGRRNFSRCKHYLKCSVKIESKDMFFVMLYNKGVNGKADFDIIQLAWSTIATLKKRYLMRLSCTVVQRKTYI